VRAEGRYDKQRRENDSNLPKKLGEKKKDTSFDLRKDRCEDLVETNKYYIENYTVPNMIRLVPRERPKWSGCNAQTPKSDAESVHVI